MNASTWRLGSGSSTSSSSDSLPGMSCNATAPDDGPAESGGPEETVGAVMSANLPLDCGGRGFSIGLGVAPGNYGVRLIEIKFTNSTRAGAFSK